MASRSSPPPYPHIPSIGFKSLKPAPQIREQGQNLCEEWIKEKGLSGIEARQRNSLSISNDFSSGQHQHEETPHFFIAPINFTEDDWETFFGKDSENATLDFDIDEPPFPLLPKDINMNSEAGSPKKHNDEFTHNVLRDTPIFVGYPGGRGSADGQLGAGTHVRVLDDIERYAPLQTTSEGIVHFFLDQETQQKVEKFRNLLFKKKTVPNLNTGKTETMIEDSSMVQMYKQTMETYFEASFEYATIRSKALGASETDAVQAFTAKGPMLRKKVEAAKAAWVTNGYKNDYEGISAYIDQVTSRSGFPFVKIHLPDNLVDSALREKAQQKLQQLERLLTLERTVKDLNTGKDKIVTEPSPMLRAYNKTKRAFDQIAVEYDTLRKEALSAKNSEAVHTYNSIGPIVKKKMVAMKRNWIVSGFKHEVEQIQAYIDQASAEGVPIYIAAQDVQVLD